MPYCSQCGVLFSGNGNYCSVHQNTGSLITTGGNSGLVLSQGGVQRAFQQIKDEYIVKDFHIEINASENTISIDGTMNQDRVQCNWCKKWFGNREARDDHDRFSPSGCAAHEECFGHSENVIHARRRVHSRCFVPGCTSRYKETDNWSDSQIMAHVEAEHGIAGGCVAM